MFNFLKEFCLFGKDYKQWTINNKMSAGLRKGLIFKSKTCEEGETFYTVILKKRWLIPGIYKTATLYKDWRDSSNKLEMAINKNDFRNYIKDVKKGNLEYADEFELMEAIGDIRNLSKEIKEAVYGEGESNKLHDFLYDAEIQKVNSLNQKKESNIELLSRRLSERIYKKALSITQILPL